MAFLHPAVLTGVLAVAAPVAIHLLNKTRVKVVRWAAMRFLMDSMKEKQRRLQIEDLILLLLRCLFVILLALAFARLVINPEASASSSAPEGCVAVILLDQSASMGQSDGFRTRFDLAKEAAVKKLDSLATGSQAALFLIGDRVNQLIPRPTDNLASVKKTIDAVGLSDQGSDLDSAIQIALDLLKPYTGIKKEIDIFTDGQATAWKDPSAIKKLMTSHPDVKLHVDIPGSKSGEENLAITSLKADSSFIAPKKPAGFLAEVSNFGSTTASGIRVTLSMDDDSNVAESMIPSIEPGKSSVVSLNAQFPKPGYYTLKAAIPGDRLPADNERSLAVHVIDRMNAMIIEGGGHGKKNESRDAFFLANALAPVPPSLRDDYYLKVETASPSWLQDSDLSGQQVIFLSNVPRLDPAAARALEKYVRGGGSLVIFPGPLVQPSAYNDDPVLGPMLPARLSAPIQPRDTDKILSWQSGNYTHPVTSLWNDSINGSLGSVRTGGYFPLTPRTSKESAEPSVIVRYNDNSPAALEAPYGKGRVALFASSAKTDWSNLPLHPAFVPFIQRLVGFMAYKPSDEVLTITPGIAFQDKVPAELASKEIFVISPGSGGKQQSSGRVEIVNKEAVVRCRDTAKSGGYRLFVAGMESPVKAFSVQIPASESNLRTLAPDQLPSSEAGQQSETNRAPTNEKSGIRREFWAFFIWTALIVALCEMILAHRFSFSK